MVKVRAMRTLTKRIIRSVIYVCAIVLYLTSIGHGGVAVFDQVTTLGTEVYLKVQTKGRFFSEGGKRVDIYVDDKKMKRILTGGDGYGYLKFMPRRPGLIPIEARSEGRRDTGVLLVVDRNDKVILIEVESGLKESPLSDRPRRDSREAVRDLAKDYKLVYFNSLLGALFFEGWLAKEKFPESAVLKWQGAAMLRSLKNRGIDLHAMVGSAKRATESKEYIQNRFTFEETRDGRTVKDWEEIMELIQKESK
jgi:hypothetical protein